VPRAAILLLFTWLALLTACGRPSGESAHFFERPYDSRFQVRVLSWNVKFGSIFPPDGKRHAGFSRIVRAVNPDVLVLQEVNPAETERLVKLMDRIAPLGHSRYWQIHGASDNAIISRYPIGFTASELVVPFPLPMFPDFHFGQGMALIDLPDQQTRADIYVIAMHNRSRDGEENRQRRQVQSDSVVRHLRNLRADAAVPDDTPIIIAGDMNVHPGKPPRHLVTLLQGDIADEATFGADFRPDRDGTALADANPSHNARGSVFYTWRDDSEAFPPGQLSRILYTDSVMALTHAFVVNTVEMSDEELDAFALRPEDCLLGGEAGRFDHMPLVADFAISN
jgi:endonuclease/exonuclease/phosphatase family metal-dependent hydrolase